MEASQTKDHNIIRQWIDERQGEPAVVRTDGSADESLLRIKFDEEADELQAISWGEFFKIFDEHHLTFLFDAEKSSRFNKFIDNGG